MVSIGRNIRRVIQAAPLLAPGRCSCTLVTTSVHFGRSLKIAIPSDSSLQPGKRNFSATNTGFSRQSHFPSDKICGDSSSENHEHFEMTKAEVLNFTDEILSRAAQNDIMIQTLNRQNASGLVEDLLTRKWSPDIIQSLLISNPAFLAKSKVQLPKLIDVFCAFGFTNEQVALVMRSGLITNFKASRLTASLDVLRRIGMRDVRLPRILTLFPELLTQDPDAIIKRVVKLKGLFKTDDVVPLILGSPNIIFDDWSKIMAIFNYVFHDMGIKQRQMVSSNLFKNPLNFVKTRHVFVLRSGFYVKPRKDDDPVRMTNPRLADIIDTSDVRFAKTFGNVSLKDYKAFSAMMKREFAKEIRKDEDSDEDSNEVEDE